MTTLGFGDITFTSDIGRLFSILVLLSGVVLLLVMLPFMFISLFYAPWLEARVRLRAPREVPEETAGHVILTEYDPIATGLIERLRTEHIPYFVIEPDPTKAARLVGEGISVIAGENDSGATYRAHPRGDAARMLLANCEDTINTNITITAREIAPRSADCGDRRRRRLGRHPAAERGDEGAAAQAPAGRIPGQPGRHRRRRRARDRRATAACRSPSSPPATRSSPARPCAIPACANAPASASSGLWERGKLHPRFPSPRSRTRQRDRPRRHRGADRRIERADAVAAATTPPPVLIIGAGKVGPRRRPRAEAERALSVHAHRSHAERARADARRRRRRCSRATPPTARCSSEAGITPRRLGVADDQRRCDEHLPGGVLPATQSRAADRQPHHPRTERRSDSPRRARISFSATRRSAWNR